MHLLDRVCVSVLLSCVLNIIFRVPKTNKKIRAILCIGNSSKYCSKKVYAGSKDQLSLTLSQIWPEGQEHLPKVLKKKGGGLHQPQFWQTFFNPYQRGIGGKHTTGSWSRCGPVTGGGGTVLYRHSPSFGSGGYAPFIRVKP